MRGKDSRASRPTALVASATLVATTGALIGSQSAATAAGCRVDCAVVLDVYSRRVVGWSIGSVLGDLGANGTGCFSGQRQVVNAR